MIFTLRRTLLLAVVVFSQSFTLPLAAQRWETEWLPGDLSVNGFSVSEECIWVISGSNLVSFNLNGEYVKHKVLNFYPSYVCLDNLGRPWVMELRGPLSTRGIAYLNQGEVVNIDLPSNYIVQKSVAFDSNNSLWFHSDQDTLWNFRNDKWTYHVLPQIPDTRYPCDHEECTNNIKSIAIDKDDHIWGISEKTNTNAHPQGWIFDPNTGSVIYDTDFGDLRPRDLWIDKEGRPIFHYMSSFYFVNSDGTLSREAFTSSPISKEILFIDDQNNYWMRAEDKAYTFKPIEGVKLDHMNDWEHVERLDTLSPRYIDHLEVDKNDVVWVRKSTSLYRVTKNSVKQIVYDLPSCYQKNLKPRERQFYAEDLSLWKDAFGEVWYEDNMRLTSTGIDCDKPVIEVAHRYAAPTYENFVADNEGIIWAIEGPDGYGYHSHKVYKKDYWVRISKFNGEQWKRVDSIQKPIFFQGNFIEQDENNTLWFVYNHKQWLGTDEYGYDYHSNTKGLIGNYDGNQWHFYESLDSTVHAITQDSHHNIWFSSNHQLLKYDGKNWHEIPYLEGTPLLWEIKSDAKGQIWGYGKSGDTLYKYDGAHWTKYPLPHEFDQIRQASSGESSIKVDLDNGIWVNPESKGGIYHFSGDEVWSRYTVDDGLISNNVRDIEVDGNGVVWFSSPGVGISRFYPESITTNTYDDFDNTQNTWQAFPNPATNSITIKGLEEEATLEVFDIHGNLAISSKGKSVVVSQLKMGMYILSVTTVADKHTFKFLKE